MNIQYKLNSTENLPPYSANKFVDGTFVLSLPFSTDNMDYQRFKQDIIDGAELQDADGVVMTPEQVAEFMADLP